MEKEGEVEEKIIQKENYYSKDSPSPTSKDSPSHDEGKVRKRTVKGEIDSSDVKRLINMAVEPQINHITCNQT